MCQQGVIACRGACFSCGKGCGILLVQGWQIERRALSLTVVGMSHTVAIGTDGIEVGKYLRQSLGAGIGRDACHVCHVESSVKVEHYALLGKGFSAVGHAGTACHVLRLHVFKPFAIVQGEQQVFFLCCGLQHTRVGKDDGGILITAVHLVYHNAVELARHKVFLLHIEVGARNTVVEYSFRNLEFRTFLLH